MTDATAPVPPTEPTTPGAAQPVTPEVPAAVRAPKSTGHGLWRILVGVALIATGIGCQVAGAGFPSNAPVEMFMNFGVTVTAAAAGVVLIAFGVLAITRHSLPLSAKGRVSPLALVAIILSVVSAVACALGIPTQLADAAATSERLRYMSLSAPAFFTGFLWSTGIVMGAIAVRSSSTLSRILSIVAVALGFAVVATNIWAAAIYSAGITD